MAKQTQNKKSKEKKKKLTGKLPSKTSINLLTEEKHTGENVRAIVLFFLFMGALMVFVKLMVVDKITQIDHMAQEYARQEENLAAMQNANSIYEHVRAEYSHYGNSYLSDEEAALQDRLDILDVIEEELLNKDALRDVQIIDNVASLTINSGYLSNVSEIVARLEDKPIVEYVTVSTAQTDDTVAELAESAAQMESMMLHADASAQSEEENSVIDEENETEQESETEVILPSRNVVTTMTIYFRDAKLTDEREGESEYAE